MDNFLLYFKIGWDHIISFDAFDHQLFLLAVTASFTLKEFRKIVLLVTAFTVGHCLTLALAATRVLQLSSYWIEILIPATIGLMALANFRFVSGNVRRQNESYLLASLFGLVHGLGFANVLISLLGKEQSLFMPLFGFNIGIELGQIAVILGLLSLQTLVIRLFKITSGHWAAFASGMALAGSIWMVYGRV